MSEDNRIIFYSDNSPTSERARAILVEKGISFFTLPSSGANLPAARLGSGVFYGLTEITRLATDMETFKNKSG